jgi:hypothetical protein
MFATGKVVKLRFKVTNSSDLNFFMFKEDIKKLLDGSMYFARIFLDKEFQHAEEQKALVKA